VSCLPGCFSAYRRVCVLHVLDEWMNATVMGEHGNFADDRSLTNKILRDYKILYDDEALATTIAPENWRQYTRQQARWMRSYLREIIKNRTVHVAQTSGARALVVRDDVDADFRAGRHDPGTGGRPASGGTHHGLIHGGRGGDHGGLVAALLGLHRSPLVVGGFVFTASYIAFYSWQIYWALITLRGKKWGTRG
jgi:hyaluronan synthase